MEDNTELHNELYTAFINKFPNFNNNNKKEIIINICKISVITFPDKKDNINFYINFIESFIKNEKIQTFID